MLSTKLDNREPKVINSVGSTSRIYEKLDHFRINDPLLIDYFHYQNMFVLTVGHCRSKTKQDYSNKSKNKKEFVDGALSLTQSGCQTNRIIDS